MLFDLLKAKKNSRCVFIIGSFFNSHLVCSFYSRNNESVNLLIKLSFTKLLISDHVLYKHMLVRRKEIK